MGFTGFPTTAFGDVTDVWTSTNQPVELGQVFLYKTTGGLWSLLKYCEATDGWFKGDCLIHDPAKNDPANLEIAPTTAGGLPLFRGIAAATVASGSRGWVYVGGYCPDASMPSLHASGQPMRMSATTAGKLSSAVINASAACTATLLLHPVAISLDAQTGASTTPSFGSCVIYGVYL